MAKQSKSSEGHVVVANRLKIIAVIAFFLSTTLVAVTFNLAWNGKFKVLQIKSVDPKDLHSFESKLQFTAKYWILPLVWLITRWQAVVHKRIMSRAIDPLSGNEYIVEEANKILNNSLEQFILSLFSQIILLAYITPEQTMTLIPLINGWHLVGRIAFWLGYPMYRTFGVMSTMTPTVISITFCLYRFLMFDLAIV